MAKLVTPEFRGSFVHLNEPKAPAEGAAPVYSMAIVLPKDDKATKKFMKTLKANCEAAAQEKFGKIPAKLKFPFKDGDLEERPEWAGAWVVNAKSKSRPGIVMPDLTPVMEPELLDSGSYYRASVSEWTWSHATGGKGVSLNLDNVMYVKAGESFSGRTAADEDFADFASANDAEDDAAEADFG